MPLINVWRPPGYAEHRPETTADGGVSVPGFTMRTSGGPTRINLEWDSLQDATVHIQDAAERFTELRGDLAAVYGAFSGSGWAHLHHRIPGFHLRLGTLFGSTAATEQTLQHASSAVAMAHQSYRSMESDVHGYFELAVKIAEAELALEHLMHSEGDNSYAYNWFAATGVGAGGAGFEALLKKFPKAAVIVRTLAAVERNAGVSPALMGRYEQVIEGQSTHQFGHRADGSLSGYLGQMGQVDEHGDIAVSVIDRGEAGPAYAVHLPDVDLDGITLDNGRSPMSLVDGLTNGSARMASAVEQALAEVGAPEGAEVFMTGFSMGGLHATNMAKDRDFQEKFSLRTVTTIASPVTSGATERGVKVTHFEDARDPVPRINGERPELSTDRMVIEYRHHNPERPVENLTGSAHDWEHNVEAIELFEAQEAQQPDERTKQHVDEFRAQLFPGGEIETYVFTSSWQPAEVSEHTLPWEAESLEDLDYLQNTLEDGIREMRKWPAPDTTSTPGTVDWGTAKKTLPKIPDQAQ